MNQGFPKLKNPPAFFSNPILSGFHPDPSVCRVDEDYYLATSSFEWFPGIPIFHSRDLVNWECIGHALNRPSQLRMVGNGASSGVWAPTLRYHDGMFIVIVTCKQCGGNLYVRSDRPEGPYSDPVFLETPDGIDPSLFWDDDGTCWFTANRKPETQAMPNQKTIYIQELDLKKGELVGSPIDLVSGIDETGNEAEAPHIFKIDGSYFLFTAEGGTWNGHMVCAYRSDSVTGPYEPLPGNPMLSHRDKPDNPIGHTGHADLVLTQNGEWWSVLLGVRKLGEDYYLGRETFLVPVSFEGGIPSFNPGKGSVLPVERLPDLPWSPVPRTDTLDDFNGRELGHAFNFLRTPLSRWHDLDSRPGWLGLPCRKERLTEKANPSLVAVRFQHFRFTAETLVEFAPASDSETAGLAAVQNDRFHFRLEIGLKGGDKTLTLTRAGSEKRTELKETILAETPCPAGPVILRMTIHDRTVSFFFGSSRETMTPIGGTQGCEPLTSNMAGGFTGAFVGMYASGNGENSGTVAWFDWFSLEPEESDSN